MEEPNYHYAAEEISRGFTRSNTSFSNLDNAHNSQFNDLETFQQNIRSSHSQTSSQDDQEEFYQDEELDCKNDDELSEEPENYENKVGAEEYETILSSMRQRVNQIKQKLKPENYQKCYNSMPPSARTSSSNLRKLNMTSNMMLPRLEEAKKQNFTYNYSCNLHFIF
jgi:glutamine synthetase adenylyltransferase